MYYYEVLVATMQYHGTEALTYSSATPLVAGTLVRVSLRNKHVLGIVVKNVTKPSLTVKAIDAIAPCNPLSMATHRLLEWIRAYYPAPLGSVVRLFTPPSDQFPTSHWTDKQTKPPTAIPLPTLSTAQLKTLQTIHGPGTFLLHGITGSGKTRVYMELTRKCVKAGSSAIILTPEIGLTAQLTRTFRAYFNSRVFVLHSQLTSAQRRDIWYAIANRTEPSVIIGPRSALFSPVKDIGLIVLDESHDNAYKNESAPHYHATRVAAKLADLHGATLVLGSATPSIEDYYLATHRKRPIVTMDTIAAGKATPVTIQSIDLKQRSLFSRNGLLSDSLLNHMATALERNEQSLLYLNRRGTANIVLCNQCGWQAVCPHCDISLTYHGDEHTLRCHVCGLTSTLPTSCPECNNTDILFKSVGTKAIVAAVQKLFPTACVQRFDTDAKKADRLEQNIDSITSGDTDIIIGTQMVGKGLDLPRLSVVGIINADSSLLIPDYTATEQTYQLISQVAGRVGRGHRPGIVIAQTYNPENAVLQAALHRNWESFYSNELQERKAYHFPPFAYLLKLRCLRATTQSAEKAANQLASYIHAAYPRITIEGPTPSFHPRERGKYSWQILLKSNSRSPYINIIRELPSGWTYDIDPIHLL